MDYSRYNEFFTSLNAMYKYIVNIYSKKVSICAHLLIHAFIVA